MKNNSLQILSRAALRGGPFDIQGGARFFYEKNNLALNLKKKNNLALIFYGKQNLALYEQIFFEKIWPALRI